MEKCFAVKLSVMVARSFIKVHHIISLTLKINVVIDA